MRTVVDVTAYRLSIVLLSRVTCVLGNLGAKVCYHILEFAMLDVPSTLEMWEQAGSSTWGADSSWRRLVHLEGGGVDVETGRQGHGGGLGQDKVG